MLLHEPWLHRTHVRRNAAIVDDRQPARDNAFPLRTIFTGKPGPADRAPPQQPACVHTLDERATQPGPVRLTIVSQQRE